MLRRGTSTMKMDIWENQGEERKIIRSIISEVVMTGIRYMGRDYKCMETEGNELRVSKLKS